MYVGGVGCVGGVGVIKMMYLSSSGKGSPVGKHTNHLSGHWAKLNVSDVFWRV